MIEEHYIHTFSKQEQDRLLNQARFLERYIYQNIDFSDCHHLLEIGCGVGAQILLLAEKFPHLKIDGVDSVYSQIARANNVLKDCIASGTVKLQVASGYQLPFADKAYDSVCIFCVLEHTNHPLAILQEAYRVLMPNGIFYCTEVFNSGLYIYPNCPAINDYWHAFNQYQIDGGGDPDIGIKLANLAIAAKFKQISFYEISPLLDGRMRLKSQRIKFINYWKSLSLSAAENLLAEGRTTSAIVSNLHQEFAALVENRKAIFYYSGKQIKCYK